MKRFERTDETLPLIMALATVLILVSGAGASQLNDTIDLGPPFKAEVVADLGEPWAMTFLPDGRMLVTEKRGNLYVVTQDGQVSEAISGVPAVDYGIHGGLGDVTLHPDFARNGLVYLTWAEAGEGDTRGAAMGRGKLDLDAMRLDAFEVLWQQLPKVAQERHYSYRMAFSPDGEYLFLTSGDRWIPESAQDTSNNLGAVLRLTPDGKAAPGNPMYDNGGVTAEIWSYGHRSPTGLAFDAEGTLWQIEMGPAGGDEFQKIEKGENYGWPLVSYGNHYRGGGIPSHDTRPDLRAPEAYWNPVISPSSMIIYSGELFPEWQGSALITGLTSHALIRVSFECPLAFREICEVERFNIGNRLRDIKQGPDGAIWLLEDGDKEEAGRLLKLTPRPAALSSQAQTLKEYHLAAVENLRSKFVDLAKVFPEDRYDWKPMEGTRSVRDVLVLVAAEANVFPANWGLPAAEGAAQGYIAESERVASFAVTKPLLIEELGRSFDHLSRSLAGMSDAERAADSKTFGRDIKVDAGITLALSDLHEHLGQLIAYARMNQIVPPWSR